MELLAEDWQSIPVLILLSTGLVKLFMGPFCINFGWRGGNIFPVIFSGVAIGFASATLIGIDSVFCVCGGDKHALRHGHAQTLGRDDVAAHLLSR